MVVALTFPAKLTDEELMLKAKYEKLKRIKKKVALSLHPNSHLHHHDDHKLKGGGDHKAPAASLHHGGGSGAGGSGSTASGGPGSGLGGGGTPHRIPEAKDAKEVAKKLIRTGALQTIQKTIEKDKQEKSRGFKRSQGKSGGGLNRHRWKVAELEGFSKKFGRKMIELPKLWDFWPNVPTLMRKFSKEWFVPDRNLV